MIAEDSKSWAIGVNTLLKNRVSVGKRNRTPKIAASYQTFGSGLFGYNVEAPIKKLPEFLQLMILYVIWWSLQVPAAAVVQIKNSSAAGNTRHLLSP